MKRYKGEPVPWRTRHLIPQGGKGVSSRNRKGETRLLYGEDEKLDAQRGSHDGEEKTVSSRRPNAKGGRIEASQRGKTDTFSTEPTGSKPEKSVLAKEGKKGGEE